MCRSSKKCNFVHKSLFKKSLLRREKSKIHAKMSKFFVDKKAKIMPSSIFWKRNSPINKNILNRKLCIYNGFRFIVVNISAKHKGFRLGEFSVTRRKPKHKGKKRQKKNKREDSVKFVTTEKIKNKNKNKKKIKKNQNGNK